jgi:hypothetical protein
LAITGCGSIDGYSFTWMGKQKKIISNNKDTAALRLSRKAVDFSWIRQIVTESVNHWVKIVPLCNITYTVIFWNYINLQSNQLSCIPRVSHIIAYQYNIILLYYYIYCYFVLLIFDMTEYNSNGIVPLKMSSEVLTKLGQLRHAELLSLFQSEDWQDALDKKLT